MSDGDAENYSSLICHCWSHSIQVTREKKKKAKLKMKKNGRQDSNTRVGQKIKSGGFCSDVGLHGNPDPDILLAEIREATQIAPKEQSSRV